MERVYELMLVLRPDFGVEEKAVKELLTKLVGDRTVKSLTILGKKKLAYPIKKHEEGVYALAVVAGKPMQVVELERQMKLGTDILRYLLIGKEG